MYRVISGTALLEACAAVAAHHHQGNQHRFPSGEKGEIGPGRSNLRNQCAS
jgi:hypothetical protein